MSFGDLWSRTLVYFGIAEEDEDYYDDEMLSAEESLEQSYRDRPNVRRLTPRRRSHGGDDWTESEEAAPPVSRASRQPVPRATTPARVAAPARSSSRSRTPERAPRPTGRHIQAVPAAESVRVHLVLPRSFNDAQQIADKFKSATPVILNLQNADSELSKRLIDFASGMTYALDGGMQRVAEKVFLLTPRNVEVSAEQRAQLLERGGFFNQA